MGDYSEPEWTAENINKKKGDTTFKRCGWCAHRGGGWCRYDCGIETSCTLLKSWDNKAFWDTPCMIAKLGKEDFESIIRHKEYRIDEYSRSLKRTKKEIAILKKVARKALRKPPLPYNREDHFKIGSKLWVFYEKKWNPGTIVPGYRSGDGCVSYVLDDYPDSKKGGGWGCGVSVPCVLLDWEYKYFLKHPKDYEEWAVGSAKETYNGEKIDVPEYLGAMRLGRKVML